MRLALVVFLVATVVGALGGQTRLAPDGSWRGDAD
jgi:hypothetical protein